MGLSSTVTAQPHNYYLSTTAPPCQHEHQSHARARAPLVMLTRAIFRAGLYPGCGPCRAPQDIDRRGRWQASVTGTFSRATATKASFLARWGQFCYLDFPLADDFVLLIARQLVGRRQHGLVVLCALLPEAGAFHRACGFASGLVRPDFAGGLIPRIPDLALVAPAGVPTAFPTALLRGRVLVVHLQGGIRREGRVRGRHGNMQGNKRPMNCCSTGRLYTGRFCRQGAPRRLYTSGQNTGGLRVNPRFQPRILRSGTSICCPSFQSESTFSRLALSEVYRLPMRRARRPFTRSSPVVPAP